MVSTGAQLYVAQLRLSNQKAFYANAHTLHRKLDKHQRPAQARPPRRYKHVVERSVVDGFPIWTVLPRGRIEQHVFHLHGGGYVEEIESHHWRFAARLADRIGAAVTLPIYPLVPRHGHTETLPMVQHSFDQVLGDVPAEDIVLSGDSAGGALVLAIAQRLREEGRAQPSRTLLFSPWLDVTLPDPLSELIDEHDPMLGLAGLREAGRMYAEGGDRADPRISPLHADLTGLGPFSLFIGTRDLLLPDARRFTARAEDAGVPVDYYEHRGMFHNWVMQRIPEGREAMNHVERILRRPPSAP
ncbi:alpha/beta hydrolase fold domain-containing protein [Amycolatopsis jiangsuensis]|uniref:Acetyl esterase/lipase n=1 Tax=Amycolatopsis jiangsuensis TaxID=1181879 RepID=A0A840J6U5_9PSEU|nr:alpha/beta hydrolase fold domain-containing protein [Amycolatopsis jiangsuensis]MBB4689124.1 acetyl esterase/lipase [Amycolatopsis jiangsuensis]